MCQLRFTLFAAAAMVLTLQAVAAVSLDDFTPRASNLPSACETLYSSDIDGCEPSDFTGGKCSSTCVSALVALTASVKSTCTSGISGDNILNAMLHNEGTLRICPNADIISAASSTTASVTSTSTTTEQSETPVIGGGTMVLSSAPLSTSGLLVDTSSVTATSDPSEAAVTSSLASVVAASTTLTTVPAGSTSSSSVGILHDATSVNSASASASASGTTTSSSSSSSSSSKSKETSSSGSQGGSPFDTSDTSDSVRIASSLVTLLPAALLGALLLR